VIEMADDLKERIKLINGDSFKILPTLEDNSIDLILTDPPYDNTEYMPSLTDEQKEFMAKEFYRLLKPEGNLVVFCGIYDKWKWYNILTKIGFKFAREIIWVYPNPNKIRFPNLKKFIMAHETALWFVKDEEKYYFNREGLMELDWFEHPAFSGFMRMHGVEKTPTEKMNVTPKPIKLARILVNRLSPPNGLVLDPFMGFGTFAIPCIEQNKRFIGIEIREDVYKIAEERVFNFYPKSKLEDFINGGADNEM
jgi:DNA modification methylase